MKASEADIFFIPGHGTPDPGHWQNRWQAKLSSSRRIEQASWQEPDCADWVSEIKRAVGAAEKPVVLVAHSLGVGAALRAIPDLEGRIVGAFFVAPPDLVAPPQFPIRLAPHRLAGFGPYPRDPLPFPSITVASRDDPHGSYEHAGDISNAWGSLLIDAGNSGHINVESGHGPWPEGTMVFAQFLSRLRPVAA